MVDVFAGLQVINTVTKSLILNELKVIVVIPSIPIHINLKNSHYLPNGLV